MSHPWTARRSTRIFAADYYSDNWAAHAGSPVNQAGMRRSRKPFYSDLERGNGELIRRVASFVDDNPTHVHSCQAVPANDSGPRHHHDFTSLTNRENSTIAMMLE